MSRERLGAGFAQQSAVMVSELFEENDCGFERAVRWGASKLEE
jgi:hypothetical protein